MRITLFVLPLLIFFVLGSNALIFGETNYEIKIPSGASDPAHHFFGQKNQRV